MAIKTKIKVAVALSEREKDFETFSQEVNLTKGSYLIHQAKESSINRATTFWVKRLGEFNGDFGG
jgi:hypothetical protein